MERYEIKTIITNTTITLEFEDWGHGVFSNPTIEVDINGIRNDLSLIEKIIDTTTLINDDSTETQREEILEFLQDIEPQDIEELEKFIIEAYNKIILKD